MPFLALLALLWSAPAAAGSPDGLCDATVHVQVLKSVEPSLASSCNPPIAPAEAARSSSEGQKPPSEVKDRLLLFWAVGSSPESIDLVSANIDHARTFEKGHRGVRKPLKIDVYLVHYDFNRSGWRAAKGGWYDRNVQYSAELSGVKMWLLKDLLLRHHKRKSMQTVDIFSDAAVNKTRTLVEEQANATDATYQRLCRGSASTVCDKLNRTGLPDLDQWQIRRLPTVDIRKYEFIWALDEDVSFISNESGISGESGLNMRRMVNAARFSKAKIISPAILFDGEQGDPRDKRKREQQVYGAAWFRSQRFVLRQRRLLDIEREAVLNATLVNVSERQIELERRLAVREARARSFNGVFTQIKHLIREMEEEKGMLEAEAEALWNATGQNITRKREELGRMVAEDEARAAAPKHEILEGLPALQRFVHQGSELAHELAAEESRDAQRAGCQVFDTLCELQAPVPRCEFRHTSFVEVLSPLIKPSTLFKILGDCPFCLKNRGSVWGLDRLWCAMAADDHTESSTSCAVLDRSTVWHMNQKTLPKWKQDAADEMRAYNVLTYAEARASGSSFWVREPETYDCVSPAQFAEGMRRQP